MVVKMVSVLFLRSRYQRVCPGFLIRNLSPAFRADREDDDEEDDEDEDSEEDYDGGQGDCFSEWDF